MAETLLAILLVAFSGKGANLVFRWPPDAMPSPRLGRPRYVDEVDSAAQLDNPWRASHLSGAISEENSRVSSPAAENGQDYLWLRPDSTPDRPMSFSPPTPTMARASSPSRSARQSLDKTPVHYEYDHLFGYSADFLAGLLCPQLSMCHQKFELLVDELAFIGHPVCADADGTWRFKPEKTKANSRGRESREARSSMSPHTHTEESPSPSPDKRSVTEETFSQWLRTFHFVLVLDIPDPSSSASGNVSRYMDIIYEQIAFTVTAVLFQEQVLSNFVETECDILGSLKDSCTSKGEPFTKFVDQALKVSSIAPAMKSLYEAIKSSYMAYVTIHNLPLELQLPPYLDTLLHTEDENETDFNTFLDEDEVQAWGPDMALGWRLPALAPWKSLLLIDTHSSLGPHVNLRGGHINPEDRTLVEGLIRFLETASVTLSLAEMARILKWDLDSQVMPTVRWLVQHRRAKVVDIVHGGLKTIFMLPPRFDASLSQLAKEFETQFSHPSIPPLPVILSIISSSTSKQTDNHFFATVVKSKELIPMYHDVVLWMLKRDLLITLHLRIRIVATRQLKIRVRYEREQALTRKAFAHRSRRDSEQRQESGLDGLDDTGSPLAANVSWLALSPKSARRHSRRQSLHDFKSTEAAAGEDRSHALDSDSEGEELGWDLAEDTLWPSIITDPGRATPLQRRWLAAMSEGKDSEIAKRFQLLNQYFDGKKTDDEILYRAGITRKQLREVLHHYEEYLQTFLHPS